MRHASFELQPHGIATTNWQVSSSDGQTHPGAEHITSAATTSLPSRRRWPTTSSSSPPFSASSGLFVHNPFFFVHLLIISVTHRVSSPRSQRHLQRPLLYPGPTAADSAPGGACGMASDLQRNFGQQAASLLPGCLEESWAPWPPSSTIFLDELIAKSIFKLAAEGDRIPILGSIALDRQSRHEAPKGSPQKCCPSHVLHPLPRRRGRKVLTAHPPMTGAKTAGGGTGGEVRHGAQISSTLFAQNGKTGGNNAGHRGKAWFVAHPSAPLCQLSAQESVLVHPIPPARLGENGSSTDRGLGQSSDGGR